MNPRSQTDRMSHRILIHDFAGHPFQVQLSRELAKTDYDVLHVYSQSIQTPKGSLVKKGGDPDTFHIRGIAQKKPFPKYSPIKRWLTEKAYARKLLSIAEGFGPDIIVSANTPLDIQKALLAYCHKKNVQFIFWVQDIYSAAVKHVLSRKLPYLGTLFSFYYAQMEKRLLSKADNIVVISNDFKTIVEDWIKHPRVTVIENWAPLEEILPHPKVNHWSVENGLSDKFCFMYAGTLGMKHNPDTLLRLARQFENDKETILVVISEGIGVERLKGQVFKEKIANVLFFDYLEFEQLPLALSSADVLVAILDESAGSFCVPSKVLTYHCMGKPILLSVPADNLVARIVGGEESGLIADSMDIDNLCQSAERFRNDGELRSQMGINAREYAEKAFNIDQKCNAFIQLFK